MIITSAKNNGYGCMTRTRAVLVICVIPLCLAMLECRQPLAQVSRDYQIGGGDVLNIIVYEEPDLSGTMRVSADGNISFWLLNEVKVAGLTPAEVEQTLTKLLERDYLVNPQVMVTVAEYRSKYVFVLGAVDRPGSYTLTGEATLLEMVSKAGGVDKEEGGNTLVLLRYSTEKSEIGRETISYTIDLGKLLHEGDISQNIPVQDRDVLYIPKSDSVYVFGEVQNPGPVKLTGREMTLLEALTEAGGQTKTAALNRTKVIRVVDGKEQTVRVNVDDIIKSGEKSKDLLLRPGDIIVVPESYF